MPTSKQKSGNEAFSIDSQGRKVDHHIHYGILDEPGAGEEIDAGYIQRLKDRGWYSEDMIKQIEKIMERQKAEKATELARGGTGDSFFAHQAYRDVARSGMIHSAVPGRTDKLPMRVKGGSYIIPADIVSGIGQGNSMAGAQMLNRMFKVAPGGANAMSKIGTPRVNYGRPTRMSPGPLKAPAKVARPPYGFAEGGETDGTADIIAAGGEYVVPTEVVRRLGAGNLTEGHNILDEMVLHIRKKTIEETRNLKPPKGSKD